MRWHDRNAARLVADLREMLARPYGYLGVQAEEYIDWVGELMGRAINYSELNDFYDNSLSKVGECLKEIRERREKGKQEGIISTGKGVIVEYYQDVSPPVLQRQNGGSDR